MCAPVFPITELIDEQLAYLWLLRARWPDLKPVCPRCGKVDGVDVHDRRQAPIHDYR